MNENEEFLVGTPVFYTDENLKYPLCHICAEEKTPILYSKEDCLKMIKKAVDESSQEAAEAHFKEYMFPYRDMEDRAVVFICKKCTKCWEVKYND